MNKEEILSKFTNLLYLEGCTKSSESGSCIREIEQNFTDCVASLGFSHLRFTVWQHHLSGSTPKNSYSVNFSNFPSLWEQLYEQKKMYEYDPIVRIIQQTNTTERYLNYGSWQGALEYGINNPLGKSSSEKENYIQKIRTLFEGARGHELNSGIYMTHGTANKQTILSLVCKETDGFEERLNEFFWRTLLMLVVQMEYAINQTQGCEICAQAIRIDGSNPVFLSKVQRKILILFANNQLATVSDIACMHNTSVSTINFHLKAIRKKFNRPGASGHVLAQFAKDHNML